jgi:hypothetical protein
MLGGISGRKGFDLRIFSVQGHDTGFVCTDDGLTCFDYAGGGLDLGISGKEQGWFVEATYLKFVCDEE